MLSISKFITKIGPSSYYTEKWRTLVEDHIDYLLRHPDTAKLEVSAISGYHYDGDFYAILNAHSIPAHFHWAIMRVNGLVSSDEFTEDMNAIFVPSDVVMSKLNSYVA